MTRDEALRQYEEAVAQINEQARKARGEAKTILYEQLESLRDIAYEELKAIRAISHKTKGKK